MFAWVYMKVNERVTYGTFCVVFKSTSDLNS